MPVPGQASPAATERTSPTASAVMAPGMKPVEKIMALMATENPQEPAKPAQQPASPAPAEPKPNQPQEAPQPETEEASATQEAAVETPAVEPAPSDGKPHEIPLDELEAIELEVTTKSEDGNEIKAKRTIKELRDGFMMQADYSRKTAEVARQREGVREEVRKGVEGERAAYYQTLQMLQDSVIGTMDPELKNANWSELASSDPATYVRLHNRKQEMDRVLGEITAKQRELIQQRETEKAQVRQEQARKSVEALEKKIPGWSDALYQKLMKTASDTYGYKPDEVGSWVDHRAFEVLHDAAEYRKLKSQEKPQAPTATKKVVVVPKAVTPGAAAPATAAKNRETEAMKQLQKRGTIADAAAVIKARMG